MKNPEIGSSNLSGEVMVGKGKEKGKGKGKRGEGRNRRNNGKEGENVDNSKDKRKRKGSESTCDDGSREEEDIDGEGCAPSVISAASTSSKQVTRTTRRNNVNTTLHPTALNFHNRVQKLALWFIETADGVNISNPAWEVIYLWAYDTDENMAIINTSSSSGSRTALRTRSNSLRLR